MGNRLLVKIQKTNKSNYRDENTYSVKSNVAKNMINGYINALIRGELVTLDIGVSVDEVDSRKKYKEPIINIMVTNELDRPLKLIKDLPPQKLVPPRTLECLRRTRKTSVDMLAQALGRKSRTTYYNVENGKSPIDTCQLANIASVFGVTPDSIDVSNLNFLDV